MRSLLVIALCLAVVGCGRFQPAWQAALREDGEGVAGAWEGAWKSRVNDHEGELRCAVLPLAEGEDEDGATHEFVYRAEWSVFAGVFRIACRAEPEASRGWTVSGAKNLGPVLGGRFSHVGSFDGDEFEAEYDSKLDSGSFWMRRVKAATGE